MRFIALILSLILVFSCTITAISKSETSIFSELDGIGVVPKTMTRDNLERLATHGECLSILISTLEYGEQYKISSNPLFWGRLWQNIVRFFRSLWNSITGLFAPKVDEKYGVLSKARLWGLAFDPSKLEEPVQAWEMLSMMSTGLSQSLSSAGVPRTLTQEVDNLSIQIEKIKEDLSKRFQALKIDEENPLISNKSWTYFFFALQHELLPQSLEKSPAELEKNISCELVLDFITRSLNFLRQMADDLNK